MLRETITPLETLRRSVKPPPNDPAGGGDLDSPLGSRLGLPGISSDRLQGNSRLGLP